MIVLLEKNDIKLENDCYSVQYPKIEISHYEYVSLENCYIEFDESVKRNTLIDFCSLLIDKSAGNPNQIIGSDFLEKSTRFFWRNFSSASQQYKIQCHSLEESSLQIRLSNALEKNIKKVRITLKFE